MRIGIVGSGIVGRLIAWHLCQDNHEIHLFTKSSRQSEDACSYIAAGMISPFAELALLSENCYKTAICAMNWWPSILASLPDSIGYRSKGTLVVCLPNQKALLLHTLSYIQHKLPDFFTPILSESEINILEPALTGVIGYHLPEAQLSPDLLFSSMNKYFAAKGVYWHDFCSVNSLSDRYIHSDRGSFEFDIIIDCRGMGAKNNIPALRGVRGEIVECHAEDVHLEHAIRFLHPRQACYIVPRENQHFVIGASQIESESLAPVTIRSALELMSQALQVLPGFYEANIIKMGVGCRPTMPDGLPIVKQKLGVIAINGMSRHGFMLAPEITAQVVKKWIVV